jgi:hypothetical protein
MSQPEGLNKNVMAELRRISNARVLSHKQWDAQYQGVYLTRRETRHAISPADTVVQHITVTLDHGPLTGDFIKDVQTVERIGWDRFRTGISYNWVVDMGTGDIAQGQFLDAAGSHTVNDKGVDGYSYNQNRYARAIAVLGMPERKLSKRAEESIVDILVAMQRVGGITREPDYVPHSLFAAKDCPCDPTRDRMHAIYRKFQKRIA